MLLFSTEHDLAEGKNVEDIYSLFLLLLFLATLAEIYSGDEASIAALSEEFGAYKYIDFQDDNSAATTTSTFFLATICTTIMTLISIWGQQRFFLA